MNAVTVFALAGFAVSAHIERDHVIVVGQRHLVLPLLGGLRPTGDHHEGLSFTGLHVMECVSVIRFEAPGRGLRRLPRRSGGKRLQSDQSYGEEWVPLSSHARPPIPQAMSLAA